jgi:FeS assembly protein IscX
MATSFGWLDVDRIAEGLFAAHPAINPVAVRFTDLKRMVLALPGFAEDPKHPANERILETIQARWIEEREDAGIDDEDD